MKIPIFIQGRMTSTRCPGKILRKMTGKVMLEYLLESLNKTGCQLVVLTSDHDSDQAVYDYCNIAGVECFRGDLNNVAKRYAMALEHYKSDAFVRISADSPLLNWQMVISALHMYQEALPDMLSNVFPRSYPKGQSVEIVNASLFLSEYKKFNNQADMEHVTTYFYRNEQDCRIMNLKYPAGGNLNDIQLSVDTEEDFLLTTKMLENMRRPHWDYSINELLELRESCLNVE